MLGTILNAGQYSKPWDNFAFKDWRYFINKLAVVDRLGFHTSCVNTVSWDDNGECILSGSDDRQVAILQVFNGFSKVPGQVIFSKQLPAESNIFVARFLRNTHNEQIVIGFKCGCVLHVHTNSSSGHDISVVCCHGYAVYDILTPHDQPTCFITISHDRTVRCFDTRQAFPRRSPDEQCVQQCSYLSSPPHSNAGCRSSDSVNQMTFKFPVTAGDVHPVDGCRAMAFGFADGFVRLFDIRRLLTSGASSPTGDSVVPQAYRLARPTDMPAQLSDGQHVRCDYGPAYITSVKFEPIYPVVDRWWRGCQSDYVKTTDRVGMGAKRLLVSHMYAPVYLFDITKDEVVRCQDVSPPDWLPSATTNSESGAGLVPNANLSNQNEEPQQRTPSAGDFRWVNPEYRRVLAFLYWLGRQGSRQQQSNRNRESEASQGATPSATRGSPVTNSLAGSRTPTGIGNRNDSDDDDEAENDEDASARERGDEEEGQTRRRPLSATHTSSFSSPLSQLTEDYVASELNSAPRCRQLLSFRGRLSCRTVIKAAAFWGRDHILSGSECGHVIIWNRWTGNPVCAVKGDSSVVNRIAPHPHLPMFACSGIDQTIKIVEPTSNALSSDEDDDVSLNFSSLSIRCQTEATRLCVQNATCMRETLASGSNTLERLIQLTAARALRSIRRRLAVTDPPESRGET